MSDDNSDGFADSNTISVISDNDDDDEDNEIACIPYKRKISKKSGGSLFQYIDLMALSFPVLKGILKRGYKIPTPTIPLALEKRDVVAMVRTNSGKTACFLIPLFEKLKARQAKTGACALILSPTRELALQTLKFIKELGRFTGLKSAVILGGDSMDNQFSAIHGNPDIIVATPGRFLHVCVEIIVFDEADRLFKMGFGEQIQAIILDKADISNTFIYSNLDPSGRKINAAKFQVGKVRVLIVTDVAARGIDIPHLDCVINFNFPAKSKLFVHRVGRCARAGRVGTAYNIVSSDEHPYLLDLHLFLGRSLTIVPTTETDENVEYAVGKLPQAMIEEELAELINWHNTSTDLINMRKVCNNAYQQYIRSRPSASTESVKRIKELRINEAGILPQYSDAFYINTADLISKMKNYRPQGTIFEIGTKTNSTDYQVMKVKRMFHKENILNFRKKMEEHKIDKINMASELSQKVNLPSSNTEEINAAFRTVVVPKKISSDDLYKLSKKKKRLTKRDEEYYIPYSASDKHTEDGLAVNTFATEVDKAQMDLTADNEESQHLQTQLKKWDRKRKKMITIERDPKAKKIRTESGVWISATYKTNRYNVWKEKSKSTKTTAKMIARKNLHNRKIVN
ncbi:ATP-dependent RNA helicase DDX54 [Trachymyrmex zeteki]|uniref:RNA helicase n=1 Tax=Mycetomoellerius zeteki TaxID=64791 RepID=A0A151WSW4_9HYME|nr:ATP-dependent RNA helicase DDX54 [Trachymyrmex zeteki]